MVVASSDETAAALASALRVLGAGVTEPLDLDEPRSLFANPLRAVTEEGPLDLLTSVPGTSYEDLRADAKLAKFGDGTPLARAKSRHSGHGS